MKKILLSTAVISTLLLSSDTVEEKKQQIADTKAKIEALKASLKELEDSLPKQVKEAQQEKADKYAVKTHAEMGYVNSKGNTDTESFTLDANVKKNWDRQSLSFLVESQYASDEGQNTKNKYLGELEYNYKICCKTYFDYLVGYKYDEFSGYDYRAYTGPGLKYEALKNDIHKLTLGSNILYARDKIQETKQTDEYISFRAKAFYSWQIMDNLKFEESLTYRTEVGEADNSSIYSKTALISKINSIFSVSLNYKVDYVNKPGIGKEHTDRTLSTNLIADF